MLAWHTDFQNDFLLFTAAAAAAIFYWLNPCDSIVAALMSFCCELNSLNRNANARREKKTAQMTYSNVRCDSLTTICYAMFHAICDAQKRQTRSSACVYVIGRIQFKSNANANGELHVRNTRASNNSFHLNYRSTVVLNVSPLSIPICSLLTNQKFVRVFAYIVSTILAENVYVTWSKQENNHWITVQRKDGELDSYGLVFYAVRPCKMIHQIELKFRHYSSQVHYSIRSFNHVEYTVLIRYLLYLRLNLSYVLHKSASAQKKNWNYFYYHRFNGQFQFSSGKSQKNAKF